MCQSIFCLRDVGGEFNVTGPPIYVGWVDFGGLT